MVLKPRDGFAKNARHDDTPLGWLCKVRLPWRSSKNGLFGYPFANATTPTQYRNLRYYVANSTSKLPGKAFATAKGW